MMRKRKLELEELDEVSIVDKPAVEDGLVRLTKRQDADTVATAQTSDEIDEQLAVAALDWALAKREVEVARLIDPDEAWRDMEAAAKELQRRNPAMSHAEALMRAVELNPELEKRYALAQSRGALEAKLRKAESWYRAQKKAAALQKREPELTREEALGRVFDAEPELYAAATGAHV